MKTRTIVYFLLTIFLVNLGPLVLPSAVRADSPFDRLVSLTVAVWLEYDRPGALYIYRGELPSGTPLPAQLTFRLPGPPTFTAGIDNAGKLGYVRPLLKQQGASYIVTYDTQWPAFQLEYYDDTLQRLDAERQFELIYRADYAVEELSLEVKEPYGVSRFSLDPLPDATSQSAEGLRQHRRIIGPVAQGQEVHWRISYAKSDPRLAAEALGLPTVVPALFQVRAGSEVRKAIAGKATWAAAALVGLIAMGGLGLIVRAHSTPPARKSTRRRKTAPASKRPAKGSEPAVPKRAPARARQARYCHRCGTALPKGEERCRKCGARRRAPLAPG